MRVCVHICVCAFVCVYIYAEVSARSLQFLSTLFEIGPLTEPGAHQLSEVNRLLTFWDLPVSVSSEFELRMCATTPGFSHVN